MYIVGTKADLVSERKLDRTELEKVAASVGVKYAEGTRRFPPSVGAANTHKL